jgi:hypothetical protein
MFLKLSHDFPTTDAAQRSVEELFTQVRQRVVDDVLGISSSKARAARTPATWRTSAAF